MKSEFAPFVVIREIRGASMIILLHGPDDYRRERKRREITAEFLLRHPRGGLAEFDFEESRAVSSASSRQTDAGGTGTFERFFEFAHAQSLFEPERLAVLRGAVRGGSKALAAELKARAGQRTLTVLLSEERVPASGPFAFLRKADAAIRAQEFKELDGAAWLSYVRSEAETRGLVLAPQAVRLMAETFANDTWRLATELDKLACAARRTVDVRGLETFGVAWGEDFRDTMNDLVSSPVPGRLAALETFFAAHEPAAKLFNIASVWAPRLMGRFAELDRAVKSGRMDYEEALVTLAIDG